MSGRIKLFILLALVGVAAAYFVGGKDDTRAPAPAPRETTAETAPHGDTPRMTLYGTVKNDRVGLRRQPGGSVFAYLNSGQRVTMLSGNSNNQRAWIEVRAGALSGWVSLSDVTFDGE